MSTPQIVKVEQEAAPPQQVPQSAQGQIQTPPAARDEANPASQNERMDIKEKYKILKKKYGELLQESSSLGEELFKARRYILKLEKERK